MAFEGALSASFISSSYDHKRAYQYIVRFRIPVH
jgi:hypothetical protein